MRTAGDQLKLMAQQIDALRVDLWARLLGVFDAAGDPGTGHAAQGFAAAADRFLSAARDEVARVCEYTQAVASAAAAADGATPGGH